MSETESNSLTQFNKLTPWEAERLACLAEECGEIIQVIGKVLRHGYDDWSPFDDTKTTNRQNLERELGDLSAVCQQMEKGGDISSLPITQAHKAKLEKLPKWTHHQPDSLLDGEKPLARPARNPA
jgi:NTP pyrophosphatase (non-canonical NTP hydrolase)